MPKYKLEYQGHTYIVESDSELSDEDIRRSVDSFEVKGTQKAASSVPDSLGKMFGTGGKVIANPISSPPVNRAAIRNQILTGPQTGNAVTVPPARQAQIFARDEAPTQKPEAYRQIVGQGTVPYDQLDQSARKWVEDYLGLAPNEYEAIRKSGDKKQIGQLRWGKGNFTERDRRMKETSAMAAGFTDAVRPVTGAIDAVVKGTVGTYTEPFGVKPESIVGQEPATSIVGGAIALPFDVMADVQILNSSDPNVTSGQKFGAAFNILAKTVGPKVAHGAVNALGKGVLKLTGKELDYALKGAIQKAWQDAKFEPPAGLASGKEPVVASGAHQPTPGFEFRPLSEGATGTPKPGENPGSGNVGSTPTASTTVSEPAPISQPGNLPETGKVAPEPAPKTPKAATAPETGVQGQESPVTTGSNASGEAERIQLGLDPRNAPSKESISKWVDQAKAEGIPAKAHVIAKRVLEEGGQLSNVETTGLVGRLQELLDEHAKVLAEADAKVAPGRPNGAASILEEKLRLKDIEAEYNDIRSALEQSGTEWGKAGVARQIQIGQDFTELGLKRRARVAKGGDALTPKEEAHYANVAKQIAEKDALIAQHEATIAKLQASKQIAKKGSPRFDKAALDKELADLLTEGRKLLTGRVSSGIPVELVPIAGKIVKNLAKRGWNSLEELTTAAIQHFKEHFGLDITAEEIERLLAEPMRPKAEIAADLKAAQDKYRSMVSEARRNTTARDQGLSKPTKDAVAMQRLKAQIDDLNNQLKTGLYSEAQQRAASQFSRETDRLRYERDLLKKRVSQQIESANQTNLQKFGKELYGLPRALQATADLSATLRQGLLLSIGNPKKASVAFAKGIKAMLDPVYAAKLDREIYASPNAPIYRKMGMHLGEGETHIAGAKEELFVSNIVQRIPGFGALAKASERHYTTFLNQLRKSVADWGIERYPEMTGNKAQLKAYGEFINAATGRGNFLNGIGQLSNVFYSPKFLASRIEAPFQLFQKKMWESPASRRQMLQSWVGLTAVGASALTLAKANGADVDMDPHSPDFLKIKNGDTRIDIFGGFLPVARLVMSIAADSGDEAKYGQEAESKVWKFLRYKLAPVPQMILGTINRKDAVGQPFTVNAKGERTVATVTEDYLKTLAPLVAKDIADLWHGSAGTGTKIAGTAGSILGLGVNTYEKKPPKKKS